MPKIIAFGHQKNVGKDAVIKFCIDILRPENRGMRIVRRGFADKLYDIAHQLYSWAGFETRQYYADNPYAKTDVLQTGKTVRDTLIELGQHMRAYDEDIWINANLKSQDFDILFVSDLRFPNEFKVVRQLGGILVHVVRPGLPIPTDEADTALNGWEDAWDDRIINDSGIDKLHNEAERIIEEYLR